MEIPIPVIDVFAGPGGLGEGFSSLKADNGKPIYKIKLSIEKEPTEHKTLELRAFYRQFIGAEVPSSYYDYLKGDITRDELFNKYPNDAANAKKEAWQAELGKTDRKIVKSRIEDALAGTSKWLLIGGPPCQAYSLVGRSRMKGGYKGEYEKDPRHFLYKEYLQILADHKPPIFVMENVKGLLSAKLNGENTFERILVDLKNPSQALDAESVAVLSYKLFSISKVHLEDLSEIKHEDFIVRSEEYGIPQARHRIIILGIRSDVYTSNPEPLKKIPEQVSIDDVISDLPKLRSGLSKEEDSPEKWVDALMSTVNSKWLCSLSPEFRQTLIDPTRDVFTSLERGKSFISHQASPPKYHDWYVDDLLGGVCNHQTRAHIRKDLQRYFFASLFAREKGRSPSLIDFPKELLPKHKNIPDALAGSMFNDRFRVQLQGKPSTTVVSHISKDGHYYIHYDPTQCRSLTVREAARLQTFPDNYFFEGNRTQQYHQVGNAVPPMLANQIAKIVADILQKLD